LSPEEIGAGLTLKTLDGRGSYQVRDSNGALHRVGAPAEVDVRPDGSYSVLYYRHGRLFRCGGPASTEFSPSGILLTERYFLDDKLHRRDGPALRFFAPSGKLLGEYFFLNHASVWNTDDFPGMAPPQKQSAA
jgi:hypothetical protein